MSLKNFHLFFIFLCLGLLAFLGYWGYTAPSDDGRVMVYAACGGLGLLVPYAVWFIKEYGRLK